MVDTTENLTISFNYWRVPSPERVYDGWIEGQPSAEDKRRVIEEAIAARDSWQPSPQALQLVQQLKAFAGCRVRLQFWNPIMFWFENEGAFPVEVDCIGTKLLHDGDFIQAYLEVADPKELPNEDGYSPAGYFQKREGSYFLLAPLANLYSITKV